MICLLLRHRVMRGLKGKIVKCHQFWVTVVTFHHHVFHFWIASIRIFPMMILTVVTFYYHVFHFLIASIRIFPMMILTFHLLKKDLAAQWTMLGNVLFYVQLLKLILLL